MAPVTCITEIVLLWKRVGPMLSGYLWRHGFVNAQIDRAQICSMTHAETKLLQSLDKQGRANTDLFSSRWDRVGCGVWGFGKCTNICPATWTWQHNGMGDMQKQFWVRGFFLCEDRYLSRALDLATKWNGWYIWGEKKKSEKTLYSFKSLSGSLQTPLIDSPQNKLRSSCNETLMISLQKWTAVLTNVTVLNSFVVKKLTLQQVFLLKLLSFWQTANLWEFCKSAEIQTVGKVKCFRKCASWWGRK